MKKVAADVHLKSGRVFVGASIDSDRRLHPTDFSENTLFSFTLGGISYHIPGDRIDYLAVRSTEPSE